MLPQPLSVDISSKADALEDNYGRRFKYLRISVTDACNFKCTYCLPHGFKPGAYSGAVLSKYEIKNLLSAFAELGVEKVRFTGGEPTLRKDICELISIAKGTKGIRTVALTTNGWQLKTSCRQLKEAGLDALNVSVDSLDPDVFHQITGSQKLNDILQGIELCKSLQFTSIKLNAVLMKSFYEKSLREFLVFVRENAIAVRFIELMKTNDNPKLFAAEHVSANVVVEQLTREGFALGPRGTVDGPAFMYSHPNCAGQIGVIAPYSKDFCSGCNRLRVTSRGGLRLCLVGEGTHSLREYLEHPEQTQLLKEQVFKALGVKKRSHDLLQQDSGDTANLSLFGG